MFKKSILSLIAALCALPLFAADITLKNAAIADAWCVIKNDGATLKDSLLAKKIDETKKEQAEKDLTMAALPPGTLESANFVLAIAGKAPEGGVQKPIEAASQAKMILGVSFQNSVKPGFDMVGMLPALKPEVSEKVDISSIKVGGLTGFHFASKEDAQMVVDVVISKDGKTILAGSPDVIKAQVTAPAAFSETLQHALDSVAADPGAFVLVIPEDGREMIRESLLDNSDFDAATKAALGGLQTIVVTWKSDATTMGFSVKTAFATADDALLVKTNVVDALVVPLATQILPYMFGADFTFPKTIATTQAGDTIGLSFAFNERDIEIIKEAAEQFIQNLANNAAAAEDDDADAEDAEEDDDDADAEDAE